MVDRTCIVTRKVMDEDALLRFVLSPDGVVTPDLARKLPGRGAWVALSRETVAEAVKRHAFSRGFGTDAKVPDDLCNMIAKQLRQQAVSTLSLARKAGEALAGYIRVEEAMGKGPIRLLLHAQGSSADGARKLNRMAQPETMILSLFSGDEMDLYMPVWQQADWPTNWCCISKDGPDLKI
jgi:uncharacterized protein